MLLSVELDSAENKQNIPNIKKKLLPVVTYHLAEQHTIRQQINTHHKIIVV